MNVINVNNLKVTFNSSSAVFQRNEAISGNVEFKFIFPKSVKYIYIDLLGKCETSYEKNAKGSQVKSTFIGEQIVAQTRLVLLGSANAYSCENIPAGTYNYPFSFQLPSNIPPSTKENFGSIKYYMAVVLQKGDNSCEETLVPFTVVGPPVDLRRYGELNERHNMQIERTVGKLCCVVGNISINASVDRRAFKPGDRIRLAIDCENGSSIRIKSVQAYLLKNVTYRFGSPSNWETTKVVHLSAAHEGPIEKNSEKSLVLQLTVPISVKPLDLTECKVMDVSYSIAVKAALTGPYFDPEDSFPIEIGDIINTNDVPQAAQLLENPPAYTTLAQASISGEGNSFNAKASAPLIH